MKSQLTNNINLTFKLTKLRVHENHQRNQQEQEALIPKKYKLAYLNYFLKTLKYNLNLIIKLVLKEHR